jgi:hypothetical protein
MKRILPTNQHFMTRRMRSLLKVLTLSSHLATQKLPHIRRQVLQRQVLPLHQLARYRSHPEPSMYKEISYGYMPNL